ncbi:MAG: hypothetical protein HFJ52_04060 [Clostridia bacterium]|nr:hypothetical protein [Clostridia bacterium]
MANIKNYPLSKLADFLRYAQEKEVYERWLTLYPYMEIGKIEFISFKEYKEKILQKVQVSTKNSKLTDEEIIKQGLTIVEAYEKQQEKAGGKNGNI